MNFISTFDELNKLYESVEQPEELVEGKIVDGLKKVATRLGADVSTILRTFAECGPDAMSDLAYYIENKAVLKALQSGNEKVLNSMTTADIEELEQDIAEYEKAKAAKKSGQKVEEAWNADASSDPKVNRAIDPDAKWEKTTWKTLKTGDVFLFEYSPETWFKDGKYVGPVDNYSQSVSESDVEKLTDSETNEPYRKYIERRGKYYCGNKTQDCNGNPLGDVNYLPSETVVYKLKEALIENGCLLKEDVEEANAASDEVSSFVLECSKCGGILIKAESEVKIDDNVEASIELDEPCQYCEASEGYTILGTLVPYEEEIEIEDDEADESDEVVEEGLFDFGKRKKEVAARNAANAAKISANHKEAEQKALKNTTVVVQMYRDNSHDPWVEDYYDLAMNAEAAAKRLTNTETDKNIVYRTMSAEQAKNLGALVTVPERFVAKFRK